jgi:hypothetical protein
MELEPLDPPETQVYIINPTRDDFTDVILGISYTLKSFEAKRFDKYVGDLIATHLKDKIVGQIPGVISDEIIKKTLGSIYL